jgi:hypothetical protein
MDLDPLGVSEAHLPVCARAVSFSEPTVTFTAGAPRLYSSSRSLAPSMIDSPLPRARGATTMESNSAGTST